MKTQLIVLPKIDLSKLEDFNFNKPNDPGWLDLRNTEFARVKPAIRCECGHLIELTSHHIRLDGLIDSPVSHLIGENACGFNYFIQLQDWYGAEYLPGKDTPSE